MLMYVSNQCSVSQNVPLVHRSLFVPVSRGTLAKAPGAGVQSSSLSTLIPYLPP